MASMMNMNMLSGKDSRWLQLEVCREYQRNKCSRPDTECKFAHPPANVEVQNGRVTACYDSIKGRCNREKPPCKYFHPPQHLKDELLINGRNHLALKNALMQQMGMPPGQTVMTGQVPTVAPNPYLTGIPTSTYNPYFSPAGHLVPTALLGPDPASVQTSLGVVQQNVAQQKIPRSDRLEMDMKSVGSYYYENFAFPGMGVPFKRPAGDKSGMPVYQPGAAAAAASTYQQLLQLQQSPYVPVSCEYPSPASLSATTTTATTTNNNNNHHTVTNNNNTTYNSLQQQQPHSNTQQHIMIATSSASAAPQTPHIHTPNNNQHHHHTNNNTVNHASGDAAGDLANGHDPNGSAGNASIGQHPQLYSPSNQHSDHSDGGSPPYAGDSAGEARPPLNSPTGNPHNNNHLSINNNHPAADADKSADYEPPKAENGHPKPADSDAHASGTANGFESDQAPLSNGPSAASGDSPASDESSVECHAQPTAHHNPFATPSVDSAVHQATSSSATISAPATSYAVQPPPSSDASGAHKQYAHALKIASNAAYAAVNHGQPQPGSKSSVLNFTGVTLNKAIMQPSVGQPPASAAAVFLPHQPFAHPMHPYGQMMQQMQQQQQQQHHQQLMAAAAAAAAARQQQQQPQPPAAGHPYAAALTHRPPPGATAMFVPAAGAPQFLQRPAATALSQSAGPSAGSAQLSALQQHQMAAAAAAAQQQQLMQQHHFFYAGLPATAGGPAAAAAGTTGAGNPYGLAFATSPLAGHQMHHQLQAPVQAYAQAAAHMANMQAAAAAAASAAGGAQSGPAAQSAAAAAAAAVHNPYKKMRTS